MKINNIVERSFNSAIKKSSTLLGNKKDNKLDSLREIIFHSSKNNSDKIVDIGRKYARMKRREITTHWNHNWRGESSWNAENLGTEELTKIEGRLVDVGRGEDEASEVWPGRV